MITISKPKLAAISIILLVASASFYLGHVLAMPSPSIGVVVTPGEVGPCDYYIFMDGTTPVAHFESSLGGTPGDNKVGTAGQDVGTFLNSITATFVNYCFSPENFTLTTQWTLQNGDTVQGLNRDTIFKAGADNFDMIAIAHPAQGQARTQDVTMSGMSFDSNGHTNINGINLNVSLSGGTTHENIRNIFFQGRFQYCMIMDGHEDAVLDTIVVSSSSDSNCDLSWKSFNGNVLIHRWIFANVNAPAQGFPSGKLHLTCLMCWISDSDISGIIFEVQTGGANGGAVSPHPDSGIVSFVNDCFCNGAHGAYKIAEANLQTTTVQQLDIIGGYIGIGNSGALFATNSSTSLAIQRATFQNTYFSEYDGTVPHPVWVKKAGTFILNEVHWIGNRVAGTWNFGDTASAVGGTYQFQPQPAQWNQTSAGLPGGTGSGNTVTNRWPWPVMIYWINATNVGPHLKDTYNIDKVLFGAQYSVQLYPGEGIYFASAVPSNWEWYGMQW